MIRKMEELSMNAWPTLYTKFYDGWVLRFANGYTRRANAVIPIYESTIPLDEKIDFCEKEYASYNLPTLFKLTTRSNPIGIDARLEERGYVRDNEAALRILDLGQYIRHESQGVTIESQFSNEWLDGFFHCSNITDEKTQLTAKRILDNILGTVICVTKLVDGKVVGCGYGAVDRGYVGIFDIVVHKNLRGNGYGKDIVNGILGTASEQKTKTAYLQVSVDNTPAEKLYDKIGFKEVYRYWYRKQEKQK